MVCLYVFKHLCVKYYDQTERYFICEHLGISHLTIKKVKTNKNQLTTIQLHLLCCNYSLSFEDFSILTIESNDFKLKTTGSLLTERDKPMHNQVDTSIPLDLF